MFKKIFLLLIFIVASSSIKTNAQFLRATGGSGTLKNDIYWVDFSGMSLASGGTITKTFSESGIDYTFIINSVSFSGTANIPPGGPTTNLTTVRLTSYIPGTWSGDGFDDLYNIGGTGASNTMQNAISTNFNGGTFPNSLTANFTITAYATISGTTSPVDLGLVFASAEDDANGEYSQGTTNGTAWKMIESRLVSSTDDNKITFSNSNLTAKMQMGFGNDAILYTTKSTTSVSPLIVNSQIVGNGKSAIALGVMVKRDYGDNPATYGSAVNIFPPTVTGGTNNPVNGIVGLGNNTGGAPTVITAATISNPNIIRLGTTPADTEGVYAGSAASTLDDTTGSDDEDAFATAPNVDFSTGSTFSVTVPVFKNLTTATNPAYVMAWYDFNKNGTFEPAEYATASFTTNNAATTVTLTWNTASVPKAAGTSYARFRISTVDPSTLTDNSATTVDERSYTALLNGETEDYSVTLSNPLDAVDDTYVVIPGTSTTSVILNDLNNSGTAAVIGTTAGQVSIRTATDASGTVGAWPANFTLNANGTISIASGTAGGTYTLYYTICNQTSGSPCATAKVTIIIQDSDGDGIVDSLDLDDDNDGILDTVESYCDNSNLPLATTSITGTGIYKKQLVFFDWKGTTFANGTSSSTTVNGVTYTATISNISSSNVTNIIPHDAKFVNSLTDGNTNSPFGFLYDVNTTNFFEGFRGTFGTSASPSTIGTVTCTITVTATQGGLPYNYPYDIVGYELEASTSTSPDLEKLTFTAATNITALEKRGNGATVTGLGTTTAVLQNTETPDASIGGALPTTIFTAVGSKAITITTQGTSGFFGGFGAAIRLYCDTDNDLIPNIVDVDSDGDGCPDAIEGSENVRYNQVYPLTLPSTDPNYAYRGQIKVIYDGVTTNTQANIVSTGSASNGVPQLINNAGAANNFNSVTNPSSLAGIADASDGTADVGQDAGTAYNSALQDTECGRCFRTATSGTGVPVKHGITALQRAAVNNADTANWPIKLNSAYTALDSKTKGFVVNRLTTTQITGITTPVTGMLVYDTTANCLKIYNGTSWNCYNTQTCDDFTK